MRPMRLLCLPLALLTLFAAEASADCGLGEDCGWRIRIASAKYGAEDQWCSGLAWVTRSCSGQWICPVTLPALSTSVENRSETRQAAICGPVSVARKTLSIGWYCSDGKSFIGQPTVALRDGERALLSCARP